jgi:septum formation topological specificity factor MinE
MVDDYALYDLKADKSQHVDIAKQRPALLNKLKKEFLKLSGKYYKSDKKGETLK